MADLAFSQKAVGGASLTYKVDVSNRLAKAYPGQTITVSSCTGSIDSPAVLSSVSGTGTSLTFKLSVTAVPVSTKVTMTLPMTLSNGDVDPLVAVVQAVAGT